MNLLYYRGMQMRIIQSLPHVRTVELDESRTTYKWTRWDLSFIVTLEPAAFSAAIRNKAIGGTGPDTNNTPPDVNNPGFNIGVPPAAPADTDKAIRRFLEYPRGVLIIDAVGLTNDLTNPITVLRSPADSKKTCDANNGPFCKVNSIQEVAGEMLWQIHLSFTTFIYEDSLGSAGPPILVSNRWSVTTDTNRLHLTDRIIDGIVHFRADQLLTSSNIADFYRNVFAAFTVPSGFQREHVHCVTLPQGNMVRYHVLDREQPYQQLSVPIGQVRLEYMERSWMWRGSVGRAAAQAIQNQQGSPPLFSGPSALGSWFKNQVMAIPNAIGAQLPKRYKTVIAKAWGNRLATRGTIVQRAMSLALARMGQPAIVLPFTGETSVSYHSATLMAQVETTINWTFNEGLLNPTTDLSLVALLFQTPAAAGLGDLSLSAFIAQKGDAQNLLQRTPNTTQPPFPGQAGTHGTWAGNAPPNDPNYLARLATQTLETIGQAPAPPP